MHFVSELVFKFTAKFDFPFASLANGNNDK